MLKKLAIGLVLLFILIQFVRIEKVNEEKKAENDFLAQTNAPLEIKEIIQTSCYDCHSNQTNYPWYTNIAPVSWYIENHINEAKHHLNFSEWSSYSLKKANHKLEECVEEVEEVKMPTSDYVFLHAEAQLTTDQRIKLSSWFKNQMR